jgi:hypothetical protein
MFQPESDILSRIDCAISVTDTTPPVDMVFDTKTNTFLEQVPSISKKI